MKVSFQVSFCGAQTRVTSDLKQFRGDVSSKSSSSSSNSRRNEYYLGGIIALLLQDHRTMSTKSVGSRTSFVKRRGTSTEIVRGQISLDFDLDSASVQSIWTH